MHTTMHRYYRQI